MEVRAGMERRKRQMDEKRGIKSERQGGKERERGRWGKKIKKIVQLIYK